MKKESKNKFILIGRHCLMNSPDFLSGSVEEAISYGSNSFMINLGSPQNSFRRKVSELNLLEFNEKLKEYSFDVKNIVVHGSYLSNIANIQEEKFNLSLKILKNDVLMMEEIGLDQIVIHPGNFLKNNKIEAMDRIAEGINLIFNDTKKVKILLETMSGKGTELGISFEEISYIISRINDRERIGVC
jgi:deoxyribonuclease-4